MERQIREYEKFIAQKVKQEMSDVERARVVDLHEEMMADFQHERLIHLLVTLFFALFAIVAVFVTAWIFSVYGLRIEMLPLGLLTLILVVLTGFYVKHYYFLENHIQKLYKYAQELRKIKGK